jgi:alpha-ribazole phosphatase
MYGASDVPCDTANRPAFEALAQRLPEDAVWITSHLSRAKDTARAIHDAGLAGHDPHIEDSFGEQNFGDWQGKPYADLEYEVEAMQSHKFWFAVADFQPPNGERFIDVVDRVGAAIARWNEAHLGRDIVVVAHGGSIRAALVHALGLDPNRALGIATDNLAVTRMDHLSGPGQGGDWRIVFTNVTP